jgi:phosphatidylglycerophosphate synthase
VAQSTASGGPPVDGDSRALTAGEVWAREQLELLLASRFAPGATGRFVAASWRRSAKIRAARPELARRAYTWLALGTAAWLAPAAAGVQPFRRRLGVGLAWWGSTSVMLDWHLGMFETEDGRPRQLGAADALTLARAWLVPVVADSPTVLVCGLAAVADALDGWLARRTEPTRAGRDLEGLVDACFALAALRGLTRAGRLGRAAGLAEASRLTAGVGYATFAYLGRVRAPEVPLVHAARSTSAVRFAGVLAAAAGRRRVGGALLVSGSVCSVALTALAARRSARR